MPFITPDKRELVDKDVRLAEAPGDLCYYFYKKLLNEWAKEKRWTTAHNLYKQLVLNIDHLAELSDTNYTQGDKVTALHLAWQVFFSFHVLPYEGDMREKNGEVQ
jgi:hypothetical protein